VCVLHSTLPPFSTLVWSNHALTHHSACVSTADGLSSLGGGGAGAGGGAALLDWADKAFGQGLSHVTKSVKTLLSGMLVLVLDGDS
jgi:hypothetical protein